MLTSAARVVVVYRKSPDWHVGYMERAGGGCNYRVLVGRDTGIEAVITTRYLINYKKAL